MFPPALPNTPEGTINFSKVPRHVVLAIGETFCKEVAAFKKQPGGQAHLDEKIKQMKNGGKQNGKTYFSQDPTAYR